MPKDALEVHMLSIGDADCILVTRWKNDQATRLLIDGGDSGTVDKVKQQLKDLGATDLDYVFCSHLDDDHAAGLVEIVADDKFKIARGYMHVVEWHVKLNEIKEAVRASGVKEARLITASVDTNSHLLRAFEARGIKPVEPFAGVAVGGVLVCGPTLAYYNSLIAKLREVRELQAMDILIEGARMEKQASAEAAPLKRNPAETAANNTSTVLTFDVNGRRLLITADAGVEAQVRAAAFAETAGKSLKGVAWMQIPHHGSRNAINQERIDYFCPTVAYVSADGVRHPSPAVIEAFQTCSEVFGTYSSGTYLRYSLGDAPDRGDKSASPV